MVVTINVVCLYLAAFRKSLNDVCLECGVRDLERQADHKMLSRTSAQKKLIVQSLVQVRHKRQNIVQSLVQV